MSIRIMNNTERADLEVPQGGIQRKLTILDKAVSMVQNESEIPEEEEFKKDVMFA